MQETYFLNLKILECEQNDRGQSFGCKSASPVATPPWSTSPPVVSRPTTRCRETGGGGCDKTIDCQQVIKSIRGIDRDDATSSPTESICRFLNAAS